MCSSIRKSHCSFATEGPRGGLVPGLGGYALFRFRAMKQLQQLLATIVEAAPFGIFVVAADGHIVFANRGAELLFGYTHDVLLKMSVDMLVPETMRERHCRQRAEFTRHPTQRAMGTGKALSARRNDGSEVPVEVALRPITYQSAPHVLAVIVDVTERRRLEQSVIDAHNELERRIEQRTAELKHSTAEKERLLLELEAKSHELERLSLQDPLTGLSNRRDLDRRLAEWLGNSARTSAPMTVALFDIDHFKRVNDLHGHAVGDEVLKDTADLLRRECRTIDVVARYGGEEFALVFPNVAIHDASAICERIRHAFEQTDWTRRAPALALTISAGLAAWRPNVDAHTLLDAADRAMYEAKGRGRNRVAIESPTRAQRVAIDADHSV